MLQAVLLRVVPGSQRSLAMGVRWIVSCLLGSIPGPILVGYLMDSTCVFWKRECDRSDVSFTLSITLSHYFSKYDTRNYVIDGLNIAFYDFQTTSTPSIHFIRSFFLLWKSSYFVSAHLSVV